MDAVADTPAVGWRPPSFDLDVVAPGLALDGRRCCTVTPRSAADTVGDLMDVVGASPGALARVDGRTVDRDLTLVDAGCVHGSQFDVVASGTAVGSAPPGGSVPLVGASPSSAGAERGAHAVVEVTVTSGPDCGERVALAEGRHAIGRSPLARLRIADVRAELHHAVIDIDGGGVTITQLSGLAPIRVDGRAVTGTRTLSLPARLSIGMSELRIARPEQRTKRTSGAGSVVSTVNDPWRHVVQRAPDRRVASVGDPIVRPLAVEVQRTPPATALIGAALAVVGAGVIAILLGQMMFALFAAFGALASAATWSVGAVSTWRRNRRSRRTGELDRQRFLDDLDAARADARQRHLQIHDDLDRIIAKVAGLAGPPPVRSDVWRNRLSADRVRPTVGTDEQLDGDRANGAPRFTFRPVIGTGTSRWSPVLVDVATGITETGGNIDGDIAIELDRAATIDDVPIPVALATGEVVAISGAPTEREALVRSIVCQMAVRHGPADWQLVVVSADRPKWSWIGWLPHSHTSTGTVLLADPAEPDRLAAQLSLVDRAMSRPTLLVVDDPALFAVRTGALRRFVERVQPATLTVVDIGAPTPAVCSALIAIGSTGMVLTTRLDGAPDEITDAASSIAMCGLSSDRAAGIARSLARLSDPEMTSSPHAHLVSDLALSDLDDAVRLAGGDDVGRRAAVGVVCRRWREAGLDPAPRAVVGASVDGVVEVDLVADGPHALVAGTTGSGKSELLRSLVVGLATRSSPEHLTFVLVDYKGGSTFDRCADLPHVVGMVTDLDAGLAERALISLEAELHRRESMLRDVGAVDLADYRRDPAANVLPRLVVVIDEFAALAKELPDFLAALVGIAQRGRSLGVHLILATQRPAGVVSDDIRANTNLRVALRLNDGVDAHDVVGDPFPAGFARDAPGRAALRLGPDELVVFQTARCSGPARSGGAALRVVAVEHVGTVGTADHGSDGDVRTELDLATSVVCAAVERLAIEAPHRPWIDALPERLPTAMVDLHAGTAGHDGVGLIDDPAAQCRSLLRWNRESGHLAVIGSLGSGTTTALRAVVAARCRLRSPAVEHWYVIDARGELSLDELSRLDHVGAVVRVQERERLHRVLVRLVDDIDQRGSASKTEHAVSLAIDGLSSLQAALSVVEHAATLALLERVLNDGPAVGVAVCWTDDPSNVVRSVSAAETWILRCDDPGVARSLGVAPVGRSRPGHLRIASCGREAVVAVDAGLLPPDASEREGPRTPRPDVGAPGAARPIDVLPAHLTAASLDRSPRCVVTRRSIDVDVGLRFDDLGVASLRVPQGDHVFIGGAASTGKSSALRHIAETWRSAHPGALVIDVDRRRSLSVEESILDGSRPVLIVVDDAERVDDADGALGRVVVAARPGVLIVAAGRLDVVRSAYGHWTRDVARSRCGLILTSVGDVEGDLLGATLPRRAPLPARPGLAWLVDGDGHRLVQLVDPEACRSEGVGPGTSVPGTGA